MAKLKTVVEVAGREVTVSNPDKVFFPRHGHTKLDLVRYYLAVADGALRGVAGGRWRSSASSTAPTANSFFQKRAPSSRPDWIETVELRFPSGRTAHEIVHPRRAQLAWIVNLGCIDLNPHPVRAADLDHPDELRVDLDPMPGVRLVADRRRGARDAGGAGRATASRLAQDVGLARRSTSTRASQPALDVRARCAARRWRWRARSSDAHPHLATSKWWKEERHGVFLDYNQNAKDRTVASAYSVRPTPDARVSTPLDVGRGAEAAIRRRSRSRRCPRASPSTATPRRGSTTRSARSRPCSSWPRATRPRASATPRGRRTTRSRPGRAAARAAVEAPRRTADGRARRARKRPRRGRRGAAARPAGASHEAADRDLARGQDQGRGAGRASSAGRRATRGRAAAGSRPTSSSTRCAAGFTTWTRIRVNLEHVPEDQRPAQEPLEVDYDPWAGFSGERPE